MSRICILVCSSSLLINIPVYVYFSAYVSNRIMHLFGKTYDLNIFCMKYNSSFVFEECNCQACHRPDQQYRPGDTTTVSVSTFPVSSRTTRGNDVVVQF